MLRTAPVFPGFPLEALTFFRNLARNNRREWFQPRKEIFDTQVKEPMIRLIELVNADLSRFAPDYVQEPKKALYRIYRDTRFSNDKTPYKTHVAAMFSRRGLNRTTGSGFYIGISHKEIEIAGGSYMPGPEELRAIRMWLAENHAAFRKVERRVEKAMGQMAGRSLQRVPKGFDAAHPAADLIKRKQWFFYVTLDPKLATSPKLYPEIVKRFGAMVPLVEMLNEPLVTQRTAAAKASLFQSHIVFAPNDRERE
jgi:uncharacterized protein (TIGR02453 family)